jgi:hypothetical protein
VGGTLERRGIPSLGGVFSCEREDTSKERTKKRKFHRKERAKEKKRIKIKTKKARGRKAHQGKGCITSIVAHYPLIGAYYISNVILFMSA